MNKKVTVLMTVYNGEKYLEDAIRSILEQSYQNFSFMIINDGSSDGTEEIILSNHDSRIIYIKNDQNIGLTKSLNKGIDLIDSEYLVRMDADDIAMRNRLKLQIKFMDSNKDIAVSGTSILIFGNGKKKIHRALINPKSVKTHLLFASALSHPSTIIRTEILKQNNIKYLEVDEGTEDYGLWQKLAENYKLSNLKNILLKYRDNKLGITSNEEKNIDKRDKMHINIYKRNFEYLNISTNDEDMIIFRKFIMHRIISEDELIKLSMLIFKLRKSIGFRTMEYDLKIFDRIIKNLFFSGVVVRENDELDSIGVYKKYFDYISPLNVTDIIKIKVKKLLINSRKR